MARGEKSTVAEMIGEWLRESAVLVAVFAPLDIVVEQKSLTFWGVGVIVLLVLALGITGIVIEVLRQ